LASLPFSCGEMATLSSVTPPRLAVAVAEDHPVMLDGLAALLEHEGGFVVTGRATSAAELRELISKNAPQVLVMDLMLGQEDGLALLKDFATTAPSMRVVVFSLQSEDVYAERCLRAGAHGYVMKAAPVPVLFQAIRDVAAGGFSVSPRVSAAMLGSVAGRARQTGGAEASLTDRELQVFRLTGLALPTREIAEKLGVSVKTVEAHRENIKNKLSVDTHAALVARAAQWVQSSQQS
jgi:DNA-binding NarL/FixJ family response regulator